MTVLKLVHFLAVLIWVGGMFFAYVVLRPAAVEVLEPPHRLGLWSTVFRRFFVWVWGSVAVLLASGFCMIYLLGGFAGLPAHIHAMLALGLAMMAVYAYVYFACYKQFRVLAGMKSWKEAGEMLGRIRKLIAFNLSLGVLTVCIAVFGAH